MQYPEDSALNTTTMKTSGVMLSCLVSRTVKIQINITVFYHFLCGYDTYSYILKKEHKLQVFESEMFRKYLDPKKDETNNLTNLSLNLK